MPTLLRALEIAVIHHAGQTSKDGEPYAFHPIRVSLALKTDAEKIAGLLHDIVEDTNVTHADLADEGFAPEILEAVRLLTKSLGDDYDAYVARIAANPIARAVKIADLADNMNLARIPGELSEKDLARIAKYHRAWSVLTGQTFPQRKEGRP